MIATVEKRLAKLEEAVMPPPPVTTRTAVEMASDLCVDLDDWQRDVLTTTARYVLMLASRQAGKSTVASLMALHQAVYVPGSLTLILSPGERQSKLLLRKIQRSYAALRGIAPPAMENRLSLELRNGSEIYALPGKEETVRGFSAVNLLIEDEAAVVGDDLYQSIRPMTAVSGGRIVLMSTPRGKRGHFYQEYIGGGSDWHRATVTADQCPRIPATWLAEERNRIGDFWFDQEYRCRFLDDEDQLFASEHIESALIEGAGPLALPMFTGGIAA